MSMLSQDDTAVPVSIKRAARNLTVMPTAYPEEFLDEQWIRRVALTAVEIIHGRRPMLQIKKLISAEVELSLRTKQEINQRRRMPSATIAIGTVHQSQPLPLVIEASAVLLYSGRAFPIALRFEKISERWLLLHIDIGPH